jgi:hypothetical protein
MLDAEQAARKPMIEGKWMDEAQARKMKEIDAANTERLAEIFKRHGFPGVALVGKDGTQAVLIMLAHTPSLELQKKALPHVEKAARRGEIPMESFASLTDTVLRARGKPQLYGTRFDLVDGKRFVIAPTKDPARLDARRAKLGLAPIAEYARTLGELYKMPVDATPPRR